MTWVMFTHSLSPFVTEQVVFQLIKTLHAKGEQVVVICKTLEGSPYLSLAARDGVSVISLNSPRCVKASLKRADILLYQFEDVKELDPRFMKWLYHHPGIVSFHEFEESAQKVSCQRLEEIYGCASGVMLYNSNCLMEGALAGCPGPVQTFSLPLESENPLPPAVMENYIELLSTMSQVIRRAKPILLAVRHFTKIMLEWGASESLLTLSHTLEPLGIFEATCEKNP